MKLTSLIRRTLPFQANARAGIPPTWDRPDPPSTTKAPRQRRQTNDEKHFNFFDAASPTYMLVNSEVAEGDLGEAFPSFVKNLSLLVLAGALVGFVGLIWSNKSNIWVPTSYLYQVDRLNQEKKFSEEKYGLKDLQSNPWKLNVWPESFPIRNLGIQDKAISFETRSSAVDIIRAINKQAQAYWSKLSAEAEESLKHGGSQHH